MVDVPASRAGVQERGDGGSWRARVGQRLRAIVWGSCECQAQQNSGYQPEFDREELIAARPDLPPPGPDVVIRKF